MFIENEQLARSAMNCLENFVISCGAKFSFDVWEKTCECIAEVFGNSMPTELLTWRPEGKETHVEVVAMVHSDSDLVEQVSGLLFFMVF